MIDSFLFSFGVSIMKNTFIVKCLNVTKSEDTFEQYSSCGKLACDNVQERSHLFSINGVLCSVRMKITITQLFEYCDGDLSEFGSSRTKYVSTFKAGELKGLPESVELFLQSLIFMEKGQEAQRKPLFDLKSVLEKALVSELVRFVV
jgi:hypothetical protein